MPEFLNSLCPETVLTILETHSTGKRRYPVRRIGIQVIIGWKRELNAPIGTRFLMFTPFGACLLWPRTELNITSHLLSSGLRTFCCRFFFRCSWESRYLGTKLPGGSCLGGLATSPTPTPQGRIASVQGHCLATCAVVSVES